VPAVIIVYYSLRDVIAQAPTSENVGAQLPSFPSRPISPFLHSQPSPGHGYGLGSAQVPQRIRTESARRTTFGGLTPFLHGFCVLAQMSMRTRTTFPLTE